VPESSSVIEQQSSNQPTRTSAPESTKASATNSDSGKNDDASTTGKASASGSQKPSGSKTTSKPKSYDNRLPAGGISLVTPNALAGSQFYKVGDFVTFAWNFTSLSQTPSAIDILATCTANQATYTIAVNQSASETQVVWDTKNTPDGQKPFLTEKYTLLIYDAESSVSAAPRAGYLAVFNSFQFGMYTPKPYVPFDGRNSQSLSLRTSLLISHRIHLLKLQLERRALTVREDDAQGPLAHNGHNSRLARLLHIHLRSVVVHYDMRAIGHLTARTR
jgi:hypothetical protein